MINPSIRVGNIKSVDEIYDVISYLCKNLIQENKSKKDALIDNSSLDPVIYEISKNEFFIHNLTSIYEKLKISEHPGRLEHYEAFKKHSLHIKYEIQAVNSFILLLGLILFNKITKHSIDDVISIRSNIYNFLKLIEKNTQYFLLRMEVASLISLSIYDLDFHSSLESSLIKNGVKYDSDLKKKVRQTEIKMQSMFVVTTRLGHTANILNNYSKNKIEKHSPLFLLKVLNKLFIASNLINNTLIQLKKEFSTSFEESFTFSEFIDKFLNNNEKLINYIITEMSKDISVTTDSNVSASMLLNKIEYLDGISNKLKTECIKILSFYNNEGNKGQWSNKIFITTVKMLAVLNIIRAASIDQWKLDIITREYYHWLDNVHEIINRNILEDDWNEVKDYVYEEKLNIEWKSSFFTPLKSKSIEYSEKLLFEIVKNILGMMNSSGGFIVVGLVEDIRGITNTDLYYNLFKKNNIYFFDINFEFESNSESKIKSKDQLKRFIQDKLIKLTGKDTVYFDPFWELNEIILKSQEKEHIIFLIKVYKSNRLTLCLGNEEKNYSLLKRMNGRTEAVDIRDFLNLTNNSVLTD